MMLPPLHVRPPPRGQNPAVPAYFFHRSGPARGGSPPAPSCPARAAGRGKPPYFGRFCPVAAPPSGRAHSHKSIAKKWKIFMECSLQFLSIFTNLFYNESSTQPRSGRARAPGGGAGRTLSGQIVPFVHRSRFPSPVFRLPGTRAIPRPAGAGRTHRLFRLYVPCTRSGCAHWPRPACSIIRERGNAYDCPQRKVLPQWV